MADSRLCASHQINTGARGSNNGARSTVRGANVGVLVTPVPPEAIINKVLVKAVSKTVKKEFKTFSLRNVNTIILKTPESLKREIKRQFAEDIINESFEIGYIHSTHVVIIRKIEDLMDFWKEVKRGQKDILWCDGLKVQRKRSSSCSVNDDDNDDDNVTIKKRKKDEEREGRVSKVIEQLKERHKDKFTVFQLRIWAEMFIGDIYVNLDDPPTTSMFIRAGGGNSTKAKKGSLSDAITQISTTISSLASKSPPPAPPVCNPVKSIDGRSKCYRQLNELNNLKLAGVLSEDEFYTEKRVIMDLLKKL